MCRFCIEKDARKPKPPLEEAQIVRLQEMFRSIAERKTRGFIYMASMEESTMEKDISGTKKFTTIGSDGLLFTHGITGPNVVLNLIHQVGMSAAEVLAIL